MTFMFFIYMSHIKVQCIKSQEKNEKETTTGSKYLTLMNLMIKLNQMDNICDKLFRKYKNQTTNGIDERIVNIKRGKKLY